MKLALNRADAVGFLFVEDGPTHSRNRSLRGTLRVENNETWNQQDRPVDVHGSTEWRMGREYYKFSAGGLNAVMTPIVRRPNDRKGPDFEGTAGNGREFRVVGWNFSGGRGGKPYIFLLVLSSQG